LHEIEVKNWRSEAVYDLCCSPHIIRVIKSRRIMWAGLVALWGGERRRASMNLVVKPEGKRHLENLNIDGSLVLKWIVK
jgi:hypothetical protein